METTTRFHTGEKVIVKVRATGSRTGDAHDVDDFFAAVVEHDGPDAGYHCTILEHAGPGPEGGPYDGDMRYFTFYDVAPYNKAKLADLRWESLNAQKAISNLSDMWKWGKPAKLTEVVKRLRQAT